MSIMESLTRRTGPASLKCPDAPSDADLIAAVRAGEITAYGELWRRHVAAAYNLARQLAPSQDERDDLVSEAFAKTLAVLRKGGGPDVAFRAYLLTALRHTAYDKTRQDRRVELAEDVSEVTGVPEHEITVTFCDPAERWLIAQAFTRLKPRWQHILWDTVIENLSPGEVALQLRLEPNAAAALAYRARQGLCTAYLQAQVRQAGIPKDCMPTIAYLGAWTRAALSSTRNTKVETHLAACDDCLGRVRELAATNPRLYLQWNHPNPRLALQCA